MFRHAIMLTMTIERNMFIDKPVLATVEEGAIVAQQRYYDLVGQDEPPGDIMRVLAPLGEHNLLPGYLKNKGYEMKLKVLESGRGIVLYESPEDLTSRVIHQGVLYLFQGKSKIRLPEDDFGFPLVLESEDGKNLELHEFISFNEESKADGARTQG